MRELLLGIDIGTSACKVAAFERDGTVAASATGDYQVEYPQKGWAQQRAEDWYAGVCAALAKIWAEGKVQPEEITGIGIDGLSWAAVPIGADGTSLYPSPLWMDTRAASVCERLRSEIGEEAIFEVAGNPVQPTYTTPKVLWYKEQQPEVFAKTQKILQSNGYIAYRLTGKFTNDVCNAYGWHCFNMRRGEWDLEMARTMGIPEHFLPDLVPCDEIVGKVTAQAAKETGLCEGTPVAAGGLDAACGTLGAGVLHDGETQEKGGQAGGMSICIEEYNADPRLILSYHVVPDRWLLQGGTTGGGGVMRWFEAQFAGEERLLAKERGSSSLTQLNEIAAAVPPGCEGVVFLPYMNGERSPIWDPKAKGVFYGLDFAKTKGHMVRACMEGVAYSLKHNIDVAEAAGAKAQVLRAVGGSANSRLWTQIKADITGKKIIVPSSDTATTLGAAMLAGVGTGYYQSYEEAVAAAVVDTREHEPGTDPEVTEAYAKSYQTYRKLYDQLKDLMDAAY